MANLIADHKSGDSWEGYNFLCEELQEDGISYEPMDLTGVAVLIQFRPTPTSPVTFEFKTADGTVLIPNPLNGTIIMAPRRIYAPGREYLYDVQLTFPNGKNLTIVSDAWNILSDISK